jgi:hypothetical protein
MSKAEPDSETTLVARAYVHSLESLEGSTVAEDKPNPWGAQRARHASVRMATPRPALAGFRLTRSARGTVFVVDRDGYRRHIPDRATYDRLFRDSSGIRETNVDSIALGPPIDPGTVLVRGGASGRTYIIDRGYLRLISSPAMIDKYWFARERIVLMEQVVLESLVPGADWD